MKKKTFSIFIVMMLIFSSVFAFNGCANDEVEVSKKEEVVDKTDDDSKLKDNKEIEEDEKKADSSSNKDTKDKAKNSTDKSKDSGSNISSKNSGESSKPAPAPKPTPTPKPTPIPKPTPKPEPHWVEEVGHWEKVMVDDAWDEYIYEIHAICSDCGADITGQTSTHWCGGLKGWHDEEVVVDTIHHDAIYEDRWVVDVPGHWEDK